MLSGARLIGFGGSAASLTSDYRYVRMSFDHSASSAAAFCNIAEVIFHIRTVGNLSAGGLTKIGTMSASGGLAAAFDGTTVQAFASSAGIAATSGTVGVDLGAGISYDFDTVTVWEPSDAKIDAGATTRATTVILAGSTDNVSFVTIQTWLSVFSGDPNSTYSQNHLLNIDTGAIT